jgi:hypothetical protein
VRGLQLIEHELPDLQPGRLEVRQLQGGSIGPDPDTDARTDPGPDTCTDARSDAGADPGPDARTYACAHARTDSGSDACADPGPDACADPGSDARTDRWGWRRDSDARRDGNDDAPADRHAR